MNVIIDGRPLVTSSAGIANFLRGSVVAWAKECPQDIFYIAIPKETDKMFSRKGLPDNIRFILQTNFVLRKLPNLIWLNVMFPIIARRVKASVFYSPLPSIPYGLSSQMKKIITVHDVVNIEYRKTMQVTNIISNLLFFSRSVKGADVIWANSYYTKSKVEHYFPQRKCQDIIVGCSIDRNLYTRLSMSEEEKENLKRKYGIAKPFILFVGSLEPRKNLGFLLSLMPEIYARHAIQLVIVGAKGWKQSTIREIVEKKDFPKQSVVFCNGVPNKDLAKLYNTAECFVSTSLNEGFGMPQLEALACGCPVVTSHNSAMIEVAQGKSGAYTVEGYAPIDWISVIDSVLQNHPTPREEELDEYDWQRIIKKVIQKCHQKYETCD